MPLLVGTALAIAGGYLVLGTGPVLDDWFALRNAHFDGALLAAGGDQTHARPVGSLVYALVFGAFGRSTVVTILLMALLNAGSAYLLARALWQVCDSLVALAAAWLWLVLPTTTSIEAWASASNISLALAAALLAVVRTGEPVAADRERRVLVLCAVAAAVAVLSYEATIVLVGGGAGGLWLWRRDAGTFRRALASVLGASLAFVWTILNWHPRKDVTSIWGDVGQVLPANLGPGIASGGAWVLIGLPVLLVSVPALLPSWRPKEQEVSGLLLIGWATLAIGMLPFIKYTYAPVGGGDRVNVVSSLGGATLIAATAWVVARHRPRLLLGACVLVAALSVPARIHEMRPWGESARDAAAIMEAVEATDASGPVVVGPHLVDHDGVTAMQLPYITQAAIQLALDDADATGTLTVSAEEFDAAAGTKIDLRELLGDP